VLSGVAMERDLHIKLNRLHSSKRFEAQRSFGLRVLKVVLAGGDP